MSKNVAVTKEQLKADLRNIGVTQDSHVAITLSFKKIGSVKGGPDALIDAILENIGPNGTLMMNASTTAFPISEINPSYVFDNKYTIPWTGIVPLTLMKRKNAIRSRHPVSSIVAIGKYAKYLADAHNEKTKNEQLPYVKLAELGGKYLSVGLNDKLVSIRHEAQRRAGLFVVPKYSGVLYKDQDKKIRLFTFQHSPCIKKQPEWVPQLEAMGIVKRGQIGMADSIIANADRLINAMTKIMKDDVTLNLCDDAFCLECRELERILNLYDIIKNPHIFQRSIIVRELIEARNKLILKKYSHISIRKSQKKQISLNAIIEYHAPNIVTSFFMIKPNISSFMRLFRDKGAC